MHLQGSDDWNRVVAVPSSPNACTLIYRSINTHTHTHTLSQGSDDWNRVVAVIVQGAKWQFKDWPHKVRVLPQQCCRVPIPYSRGRACVDMCVCDCVCVCVILMAWCPMAVLGLPAQGDHALHSDLVWPTYTEDHPGPALQPFFGHAEAEAARNSVWIWCPGLQCFTSLITCSSHTHHTHTLSIFLSHSHTHTHTHTPPLHTQVKHARSRDLGPCAVLPRSHQAGLIPCIPHTHTSHTHAHAHTGRGRR